MLTRRQLEVARRALSVAAQSGASARPTKALVLAGLTESNLTHLRGGDRDSTGFLQQRPSQGWGPVGESVERDAAQFLAAAVKLNRQGFKGSAGELAQAVQRSAFPERYDERSAEGEAVLRALGGGGASAGGSQPAEAAPLPDPAQGPSVSDVPVRSGLAALVAGMTPRSRPGTAGIASPGFAAQAPVAGTRISSGGGPPPRPDVSALLEAVRTGPAQLPSSEAQPEPEAAAAPASSGAGIAERGRVILQQGADRSGVPTSRSILKVAEMVAGEHGAPLTVGTGSQHSKFTASGNVSDHWVGRGVDIPAAGAKLTDLGRDALVALGVSPKKAAEMARTGGIFNIPYGKKRRVQVIVNTDDHYDHLHLGVSGR